MFQLWLTLRLLKHGRLFNWSSLLSLIGIIIGVATLVITMSVMSGVETLLRTSVIDVTGHLILMKPGGELNPQRELMPKVKKLLPEVVGITPFVHLEAVAAESGKIQGVLIEGIELSSVDTVLNLKPRLIEGGFSLTDNLQDVSNTATCLIGKELARKLGLKVGSILSIVIPKPSHENATSFSPRQGKFLVTGILDLGKYEFNERLVVMTDHAAQELAGIGAVYSGLRLRLKSENQTQDAGFVLTSELGHPYWVRDWFESNYNFFSAIAIEKRVIFIVLLFMIVVAGFNVSSTLFVNVLKRYQEISVLKTLGANRRQLIPFFVMQGMAFGILGSVFGVCLGMGLAILVSHAPWIQVPAEVYKFDHLPVEFRFWDIASILVATWLICLISTLLPAVRGARLNPIEGLRYE